MAKFPLPPHVPRYPLEMLFGEGEMEPNLSLPVHPADIIKAADVIIGHDVMTEHDFLVYGRETLQAIAASDGERELRIIVITLDQETEDLERLIALVDVLRGSNDYEGGFASE